MEGTVTISLADYELLKQSKEKEKLYFEIADKQVKLLEKIEKHLQRQMCYGNTYLLEQINTTLSEWYG